MVPKPVQVWHHLNGFDLLKAFRQKAIKPTVDMDLAFGTPRVLLSTTSDYEPLAREAVYSPTGGTPRHLPLSDLAELRGGLYRIGVDTTGLDRWKDVRSTVGAQISQVRKIEEFARTLGALPNNWWLSTAEIPFADWKSLERLDCANSSWQPESFAGKEFEHNMEELLKAASLLLTESFPIPCLMILYATIDTLTWLSLPAASKKTDGKSFLAWVDKYLLPQAPELACTAVDLYGARCGLLHTRSPNSTMKGAREIVYAFKEANAKLLSADLAKRNCVAVNVPTLIRAVAGGYEAFKATLASDREQSRVVRLKAAKMMPTGEASKGLAQVLKRTKLY